MVRESALGAWTNPGEINDHRPACLLAKSCGTEFGLPPSNMKGAFGNEGVLRFFDSRRARTFRD